MTTKKVNGRKGFVFSLDAAMAGMIFIIMLIVIANYGIRAEGDSFSNMQVIRMGSDIVAIMEYGDFFDTLDSSIIEGELANKLDDSPYEMRIRMDYTSISDGTLGGGGFIEAGDAVPNDRFIGTGRRYFVVTNAGEITHYANVSYFIWTKVVGEEED